MTDSQSLRVVSQKNQLRLVSSISKSSGDRLAYKRWCGKSNNGQRGSDKLMITHKNTLSGGRGVGVEHSERRLGN